MPGEGDTVSTVDERGRVVIPRRFRAYLPEGSKVSFRETANGIAVNFERDDVEFLTDEYLQTEINQLRKSVRKTQDSLAHLRSVIFDHMAWENAPMSRMVKEGENEKR